MAWQPPESDRTPAWTPPESDRERPTLRELNMRNGAPIPPTAVPGRRTAADVEATVHPRLLAKGEERALQLAGGAAALGLGGLAGAGLRAAPVAVRKAAEWLVPGGVGYWLSKALQKEGQP